MKLTKKTVETKVERTLEITESEFREVATKVVSELNDRYLEVMKDTPSFVLLSLLMYTEAVARLAHELFEEEEKE